MRALVEPRARPEPAKGGAPSPVWPAPAATQPKFAIENVSKRFKARGVDVHALDSMNLSVAAGEFVCLVGPSGCGKSTLLDIMAGLAQPDSGRVLCDGQEVKGPGRHRLVMFQESALFPWLDVLGNVLFGLKLRGDLGKAERLDVASRAFDYPAVRAILREAVAEYQPENDIEDWIWLADRREESAEPMDTAVSPPIPQVPPPRLAR